MNPIVATAAAGAATGIIQSDTTKKAVNILLIGAGGYIVYRIGKKIYQNYRKNEAQHRAGDDPHVRVAMGLRSAMNPSGISWMMSFDTTNLTKMYEYAGQITNLSAVQNAYKDLYRSNLLDDVQKELNNTEYQKFMTLVTSNNNLINKGSAQTAVRYASPMDLIVAKTALNVRSSPKANYSGKIWEKLESNKNIIRNAKKGEFIGYATGRQEFDVKNNVKFIEVGFKVADNLPANLKTLFGKWQGKEARMWVTASANYVDKFATQQTCLASYPSLQTILTYLQPPSTGLKGLPYRSVLTATNAFILGENMKPLVSIAPNVLLGDCIMILRTNNGKELVKFRNVQGFERWVDKKQIKIINA